MVGVCGINWKNFLQNGCNKFATGDYKIEEIVT